MVSVSDSRSSVSGSITGWGHCVVFLGKTHYFYSASLPPRVWVPVSCQGNVKKSWGLPVMDYHPIQGSSDTPNRLFHAMETGVSTRLISHLIGFRQTLTFRVDFIVLITDHNTIITK